MGTPAIYWYPTETGTLEVLDLGEELTDLTEWPQGHADDAVGGDLIPQRSYHGMGWRVGVVLERFDASSLERQLRSLEAHLFAGGPIGLAKDQDKAWASVWAGSASRGDSVAYTAGNGFTAWSPAAALVAGDELVIEEAPPASRREVTTVATTPTADHIALTDSLRYDYSGHVVVRHRDFYPLLTLPRERLEQPLASSDHRRTWTLDLVLDYSVAAVQALWGEDYSTGYETLGRGRVGTLSLRGLENPSVGSTLSSLLAASSAGRRLRLPGMGRD